MDIIFILFRQYDQVELKLATNTFKYVILKMMNIYLGFLI